MKVLYLTLKARWFDMIEAGIKKEEYREIKQFWISRLQGKEFDVVCFRNGYSSDARELWVECKGITQGKARPEWAGGEVPEDVFVISLGEIIPKPINL
jgi:hypothetical protein